MSNLLIGSSNVAKFYKPDLFKDFKPYQMMRCTTMDSFSALMKEIEDGYNNVVVSVLENIIVDAAGSAKTDETIAKKIVESIKKVTDLVENTAFRLPDSKFILVMPLKRPSVGWYEDRRKLIDEEVQRKVAGMKVFNVTRMNCMCISLQQFEKDGVHLTAESGANFIEVILKAAEEIFNAIEINSEKPGEYEHKGDPTDLAGLVSILKTRFESDNMMFARLREEIDSTANKSREDRVVVTGITCKEPLPRENRQRIERLKELTAEVFEAITPGFGGKILYASQGRNNDHMLPMCEVKLDKVEHAVAIRKAFAEKRKKEQLKGCLERIFISNSINVGTRVRIEILKAVAKRVSDANELAYVASFISRPVMHVKPRNDKTAKPMKSFTFIDAIKQFGSRLRREDLQDAYAKAGNAFLGQLEQNFVVLKDSDSAAAQTNFHQNRIRGRGRGGGRGGGARGREDGPSKARGVKRPGDETESTSAKK